MRRQIWMFSGQGSQYYRMAERFFRNEPVFRNVLHRCDEIVAPLLSRSLIELVYGPREDRFAPFDCTLETHPALFAVQFAAAEMLLARGERPDVILGYSLGEFVGWAVAGSIDLETALRALVRQARLLEENVPVGAMAAVLDAPAVLERVGGLGGSLWIATRNAARHFVFAGAVADVGELLQRLERVGVVTAPLPVTIAFHTPLVAPIEADFRAHLQAIAARAPHFNLISGNGGRTLLAFTVDGLWDTLRQPIDFIDAVDALERQGPADYLDLGPSGAMATLVKQNFGPASASTARPLITPWG
ncbi:MAG: acyltransferase domain-containing protein [Xanthobacteraceae bacterium]